MNLTPIDPRTLLSASRPALDPSLKKARDLRALREHTREFEALFINEMFKAMRQTVPQGGLVEKSSASGIYEEMLDMERARHASRGRGFGLAEAMYEQLRHLVENRLDR